MPSGPPTPSCAACADLGFVRHNLPFGDPDFGRAFPCPACHGLPTSTDRAEHIATLWELSGIDPLEREHCTFPGFDQRFNPGMQAAFAAAQVWGAGEGPPFLVLSGTQKGVGKTHLAIAAAGACIERAETCAFRIVPRLLDDLRATQRRVNEDERQPPSLERVRHAAESYPALVLDDLGANKGTDWADEQLFSVINERWRRSLRTLVTSNVSPDRLEARTRSRLLDTRLSTVVVCTGDDYRLRRR